MRRLDCKMKSNRKRILIYDAKLLLKKNKKDTYNRKILNSKAKKSLSPIPMTQVQKQKIRKNLNLETAAMKTKLTGSQKLIDPNLKVKRTVLKASQKSTNKYFGRVLSQYFIRFALQTRP